MAANHAKKWQDSFYTDTQTETKKVVIRSKSWITKGEKILYSFLAICLLIAGGYLISFSSSTDTLNRELQTLQEKVEIQHLENEGLLFEIKELSRPERIIQIADKNGLKLHGTEVKQANADSQ